MFTPMDVLDVAVPTRNEALMMIAQATIMLVVAILLASKAISFLKTDKPRHHLFLVWMGWAVQVTATLLYTSTGLITWLSSGNVDIHFIAENAYVGIIIGGSISFAGFMILFIAHPRKNWNAQLNSETHGNEQATL